MLLLSFFWVVFQVIMFLFLPIFLCLRVGCILINFQVVRSFFVFEGVLLCIRSPSFQKGLFNIHSLCLLFFFGKQNTLYCFISVRSPSILKKKVLQFFSICKRVLQHHHKINTCIHSIHYSFNLLFNQLDGGGCCSVTATSGAGTNRSSRSLSLKESLSR